MRLDQNQIHLLSQYLSENGLHTTEVQEDVLDHICTEIEALLEQGESIEAAMETVKDQLTNSTKRFKNLVYTQAEKVENEDN